MNTRFKFVVSCNIVSQTAPMQWRRVLPLWEFQAGLQGSYTCLQPIDVNT